jgi:hypothetical protein
MGAMGVVLYCLSSWAYGRGNLLSSSICWDKRKAIIEILDIIESPCLSGLYAAWYFGCVNAERTTTNVLPHAGHEHHIVDIHLAGLVQTKGLSPFAERGQCRNHPVIDRIVTCEYEPIMRCCQWVDCIQRALADRSEAPASGKAKYGLPLFKREVTAHEIAVCRYASITQLARQSIGSLLGIKDREESLEVFAFDIT